MTERLSGSPFIENRQPQEMITEIASHLFMLRVKSQGKENLAEAVKMAKEGKKIIVIPNHLSNGDAPALLRAIKNNGYESFAERLVFVQGVKLDRHPITGPLTRSVKVIKIWPQTLPAQTEEEQRRKKEMNEQAANSARESLEQGYHLVVFPEGGRSYGGSLKHAERSSVLFFTLSEGSQVIALPVGISGTEKALPPKKFPRITPSVNVNFGKPLNITSLIEANSNLDGTKMRRIVIDKIMREGIAPILPPKYRGVYS